MNNGKQFFAVGFPNASGGYEVRNKYFKGLYRTQRHHLYTTEGRAERNLLHVRGIYGLSFFSDPTAEILSYLSRP